MTISDQEKAARAERKRRRAEIRKLPGKAARRAARIAWKMETPVFDAYKRRDDVLRSLGFASYADYLQSDLWATLRKRCLGRYRHRCHMCGNRATCVHHRSYDKGTLTGKCPHALVALCHPCHKAIEFQNGEKTHLFLANRAILARRKQKPSASNLPAEFIHHWNEQVQPHTGQGCPITPQRVGESTPGNETPSRGSVITAPGPRRSTTTERLEPAQSRDLEGQ